MQTGRPIGEILKDFGVLFFPDLKDVKRNTNLHAESWTGGGESQDLPDFKLPMNEFFRVLKLGFGRKAGTGPITVPAAYVGKFALSLKRAGFDVLATDPSSKMVRGLKKLGLNVHQSGFEDQPIRAGSLFSAAYEPIPVTIPTRFTFYLGILHSLAHTKYGFVQVDAQTREHLRTKQPKELDALAMHSYIRGIYGAKMKAYALRDFEYRFIKSTPAARKRARNDLRVIEILNKHNQGEIRLNDLAREAEMKRKPLLESLQRIHRVVNYYRESVVSDNFNQDNPVVDGVYRGFDRVGRVTILSDQKKE